MHLTITLTAGQRVEYNDDGDFFRLMSATAPVSVEYYKQGREIAEAEAVGAGYAEKFINQTFDRFIIKSATAQTIQIATRFGNEVYYDTPPVGNVSVNSITNIRPFSQTAITVTNTSSVISTAKSRTYLLIQNNNTSGKIAVNLTNATADFISGIQIDAGGTLELQGPLPTTAIHSIGDIASNPNIVLVEATF